ncbi:MAG TPA: Tn3 family transposase [Nonomuraea sp.]|nr:Tn3 family transposase [Nonomuraea sp.]
MPPGQLDNEAALRRARRLFINPNNLREAIRLIVNATLKARDTLLWGEATSCASDSCKVGSWSANFMTEWHERYHGPGIMVYWHVERRSVCIYSQVTSTTASEVASMIEGLLRHLTDAEIDRQYTDTHGASIVGFAFSELLSFKLLYGKAGDLTGDDRENVEVSALALHLVAAAISYLDTRLIQVVLRDPAWRNG